MKKMVISQLERVPTNSINKNPENPRLIFDEPDMEQLRESIRTVGILVPLIVYRDEQGKLFLLDGERRWRCAKEIGLTDIPVNIIAKPTPLDNILRMFNIHKVRKEWSIIETAWKLEKIIKLTGEKNEGKLAELTGLKRSEIRRLKILLSFPREYQDKILEFFKQNRVGPGEKSTAIKPDFLIEMFPAIKRLEKEYPEIFSDMGYKIVDLFIDRYKQGAIKNVTDFRLFRKFLDSEKKGVSKQRIASELRAFVNSRSMGIKDLYDRSAKSHYDFSKIIKISDELALELDNFDLRELNADEREKLQQSFSKLKEKLVNALKTS